jgi:hypothetical protein
MAKLLSAVKTSVSEREAIAAGKALEARLRAKDADAASVTEYCNAVVAFCNVLLQQGDGAGKRFSGSAGHDLASNAVALQRIVKLGNLPTIA